MFLDDFSTLDRLPCGHRLRNRVDDLPRIYDWNILYVHPLHPLFKLMDWTAVLLDRQTSGGEIDPSVLASYTFTGQG